MPPIWSKPVSKVAIHSIPWLDHNDRVKRVARRDCGSTANQVAGTVRVGQRHAEDHGTYLDKQIVDGPGEL